MNIFFDTHWMACPTCGKARDSAWCTQCGTLDGEVPRLVRQCLDFASHLTEDDKHVIDWFEATGIRESITTGDEN